MLFTQWETNIIFASCVHANKETGSIHAATQPLLLTRHIVLLFRGATTPSGPGPSHYRGLDNHTQTHHARLASSGRVISETTETSTCTAHNIRKIQRFEPAVPESERPQLRALHRAVTGIILHVIQDVDISEPVHFSTHVYRNFFA